MGIKRSLLSSGNDLREEEAARQPLPGPAKEFFNLVELRS